MLNSALHCGRYSQIFFQSTKNEEKCEKYNQYVSDRIVHKTQIDIVLSLDTAQLSQLSCHKVIRTFIVY